MKPFPEAEPVRPFTGKYECVNCAEEISPVKEGTENFAPTAYWRHVATGARPCNFIASAMFDLSKVLLI